MYGGGYQWGGAAPAVTTTTVAAAPVAPVGQVTFNAPCFKMFGAVLALMAAATLALGIADVVMTMQTYCTPWTTAGPVWCTMTGEPYIWTWVASAIWGSIPIFLAGLFSMCIASNPVGYTRIFALLMILSGVVFAPAILVLTSMELWRGSTSQYTFYNMNSSLAAGSILPNPNPYQAKFAIPLVIAILAGIMFLMTGIVTLNLCCCMESMGIYLQPDVAVTAPAPVVQQTVVAPAPPPAIVTKEVYYPPRPQISAQAVAYADDSYDPYSRFAVQPYATRYNNVPNPYGSGVMYGKFPSRAPAGNSFASDFFQPNPAYFWK